MCGMRREIEEYCKTLIKAEFYGETNSHYLEGGDDTSTNSHLLNLGHHIQGIDRFLNEFDDVNLIKGDEDDFLTYLKYIAEERKKPDESIEECYERLVKDKAKFLELYKKRGLHSQTIIRNVLFWGSRQQLRAGKVVADFVDPEYGPLDPIYGILLNPTGGILGRGEYSFFHKYLFDGEGMYAFHAAAHDSFGYLQKFHDQGPGYDYATPYHICVFPSPVSGQVTGILLWKRLLKQDAKYFPTHIY